MASVDYAARAQALVGTRFRKQGRGEGGLDCIGVVLATYEIRPDCVRRNYSLRGEHLDELTAELDRHFRRIGKSEARPGEVMLLSIAENQLHLAVRTARGFVHAHAGIGRVVETPGDPPWRVLGIYRKRRKH